MAGDAQPVCGNDLFLELHEAFTALGRSQRDGAEGAGDMPQAVLDGGFEAGAAGEGIGHRRDIAFTVLVLVLRADPE